MTNSGKNANNLITSIGFTGFLEAVGRVALAKYCFLRKYSNDSSSSEKDVLGGWHPTTLRHTMAKGMRLLIERHLASIVQV